MTLCRAEVSNSGETGLVTYPSNPAARQSLCRSSAASAVMATIGVLPSGPGKARIRLKVSLPSMPSINQAQFALGRVGIGHLGITHARNRIQRRAQFMADLRSAGWHFANLTTVDTMIGPGFYRVGPMRVRTSGCIMSADRHFVFGRMGISWRKLPSFAKTRM